MCRRCLFVSHPQHRILLWMKEQVKVEDRFNPNEFHRILTNLCRHDKKRVQWALRLTRHPRFIRSNLIESIREGKPLVPHADLLVAYGQVFQTEDFSEGWETNDDAWGKCYVRSLVHARKFPDMLLYAEGLCASFITASPEVMHAWNVTIGKGWVFDSTWPMSHWNQYFGIVFDLDWVKKNCVMECGIFYPEYWPHNEAKVREYLSLRKELGTGLK